MIMNRVVCLLACIILLAGCRKKDPIPNAVSPVINKPQDTVKQKGDTAILQQPVEGYGHHMPDTIHVVSDSFISYLIKKGNNYCENNAYASTAYTSIHFRAILDSSCIYTTQDPANQEDINKLYGFADCSSFHQSNSARFGWDWYQGQMHIHAYCYDNTVRSYKELGTVPLNQAFDCVLTVLPGKYIFTLNGKSDTMSRGCTDVIANGYKLLPYFGGDEPCPHDLRVKIREM
jgi:predicted small lipoprotein YifL